MMDTTADDWDHDDAVPPKQYPFGARLRNRQIKFVPAAGENSWTMSSATAAALPMTTRSAADIYRSIVLSGPSHKRASSTDNTDSSDSSNGRVPVICAECKQRIIELDNVTDSDATAVAAARKAHEGSIAHQASLTHAHPPSALDRRRMGFAVLAAHGWDPDARVGLGPTGLGVRVPLAPVPKHDTFGLGLRVAAQRRHGSRSPSPPLQSQKVKAGRVEKQQVAKNLKGKHMRKHVADQKRRLEAVAREFFGNPDVERYLGGGRGDE